MDAASALPVAPTAAAPAGAAKGEHSIFWEKAEFSFQDLLDIINPLQHLPIVGTVYRWLTGDQIGNLPRVAGDLLFGGPIGLATGLVSAGIKEWTGRDPGEHVVALLTGEDGTTTPEGVTVVADAKGPGAKGEDTAAAAADPLREASAAPAAAAAPPPPAPVADHPPMPLYRTASLQLAAGAVAAPAGNPGGAPTTVASIAPASAAQQQFLAQRGTVEHRAAATPTRSAPVPLQLSGGMGAIPGASPGVTRAGEADFARRMMEALDKYRDMQGAHGVAAAGPAPGSLVNLSQ